MAKEAKKIDTKKMGQTIILKSSDESFAII